VIAIASSRRRKRLGARAVMLRRLHLDGMLFAGITAVMLIGLAALYSAVGQNGTLVVSQLIRMLAAFAGMLFMAQIEPGFLRRTSPWVYAFGLVRFQPSEIMKLGLPMMLAWLLHERPLPPSFGMIATALVITLVPVAMIALQPDLGTAILITLTGATVIFLSGIGIGYIVAAVGAALISLPVLWYFVMHDYQKSRVLTLINPDSDPLGAGYHIIQSKIAIGSGGLFGKGWLNGSQGQLEFLPERSTDFIFAIIGEEFGLMGTLAIMLIYLFIVGRGLVIAVTAQDTFSRLLAGSISLTFFFYVFVNTAMVTGLIPVVGVPLPLVSAGGTSMVTLLAGFGILMSIQTHRKLLAR